MTRALEARLRKLEEKQAPAQLSHEDMLGLLDREPPTEAENAALDAQIEAEAIAEFGSLAVAAVVARTKAQRTKEPYDELIAIDLELRAERREVSDALH